MLNKKTFICKRCGECCKVYTIKLNKKDIKKIERIYNKDYFLCYDNIKNFFVLKRIKNKCIFLKKEKNSYFCEIYSTRPEICKKYPFFRKNIESCRPVHMFS